MSSKKVSPMIDFLTGGLCLTMKGVQPSEIPKDGILLSYKPRNSILERSLVFRSNLSIEEKIRLCSSVANHGGEIIPSTKSSAVNKKIDDNHNLDCNDDSKELHKFENDINLENENEQNELQEIRELFTNIDHPLCYDGFEPSGRMHLAQGIFKSVNVNKLTDCGCIFVFWIADIFAMMNNKLDGDMEKIRRVGLYFIEVWRAVGMRMQNVRFLWASEEIAKDPLSYWSRVMKMHKANSVSRIKRCGQIMGRESGDELPASQILYPCMQAADIFYLGADICQLGLDQRKVNMLAREYLDKPEGVEDMINRNMKKPVIVSHGMMPGLSEGNNKMSKSDINSAIWMEDTPQEVAKKIKSAYCPPCVIEENPCISYVKMLVFEKNGHFKVKRKESNGGDIVFNSISEFEEAYVSGQLHPGDLKLALILCINAMLTPVRNHFESTPELKQLLSDVRSYRVSK